MPCFVRFCVYLCLLNVEVDVVFSISCLVQLLHCNVEGRQAHTVC